MLNNNKINIDNSTAITKPEIQLLLCCARTKIDRETTDRIKKLLRGKNIDWQYLIDLAAQHGVLPLLFNSLNNVCPDVLPENVLSSLRSYFEANAVRNLSLSAKLLSILDIFEANNISAIPFKGAALASSAYGNLAYRTFCDLDILIDKENIKKGTDLLIKNGYQIPDLLTEIEDKSYFQNNIFLESKEYQKVFKFTHPTKDIAIELHWSLTTNAFPFPVKYQELWENRRNIKIAGKKVAQFNTETLLIYLCLHASKHHWSKLKWICDVSEFIQSHPQLDWKMVNNKAKNWGCDRMVDTGLLLAHELLNLELPDKILLKINRDIGAKRLAKEVVDNIFTRELTNTEEHIFIVKSRERLQDKIHCLSNFVFVPTAKEWNYIALPKSISFLYYLIRPYRLVKEYLTSTGG